jgi:predicted nucleic acid-binding protein
LPSSDTRGRIENRIYSHNETLHTPHLLDLEVTHMLRRLVLQRVIFGYRADEAISIFWISGLIGTLTSCS